MPAAPPRAKRQILSDNPGLALANGRALLDGPSVADAMRRSASGVELARAGFDADVEVAVETDTSGVVPVLRDGAFQRP